MEYQKTYNRIFFSHDDYGYLQLLLHDTITANSLFFNGLSFYYYTNHSISAEFKELDYSRQSKTKSFVVEKLGQVSFDTILIKFQNGDVFQLYFMGDGRSGQLLSILTPAERNIFAPVNGNIYDAALGNIDKAEECEVDFEM